MLAAQVTEQAKRIEAMDAGGTRGIATVSLQVTQMAAEVAGLNKRIGDHEINHEQERRARVVARRWFIMAVIAALAVVETPILYIVTVVH